MWKSILYSFFWTILAHLHLQSQINAYAKVTAITNGSVLTLSNVNQTFGTFVANEKIVIIQMQGADITGNTANNASFGNLSSLNSAGLYEVAQISAVNGGVSSMTLTSALLNTYSSAGSVQILTYPKLGTTNYSTTANITGVAWNGNVGGVVAFFVDGNLHLFHNINANAIGFRGGAKAGSDGGGCETATFINAAGNAKYASKGEGVYITAASEAAGRAKAVNGGGGGIVHNGGGGGGGNYTAGGNGYFGYTGGGYCSAGTDAGGQGGLALSSNSGRVFMGGGGGGGQENNGVGSNGGVGGGIILLDCDTIVVSGACSAVSISANGAAAANGGNDGMGGGGAGGSMVLNIKGIRAIAGCPITIAGNGGNGGSVGNGGSHGAGGGGGQGAIYVNASGTFTNATFTTNNGAGGSANNGGSPPTAGSGAGSSGSGLITGSNPSPLPIELADFSALEIEPRLVEIRWETASEKNNKLFELYHSNNGYDWELLASIPGSGNSSEHKQYNYHHFTKNFGLNYYRLKQVDYDNKSQLGPVVYLSIESEKFTVRCYPNPSEAIFYIESDMDIGEESLAVMDAQGIQVNCLLVKINRTTYRIDLNGLPKGLYFLHSQHISEKLLLH